MAKLDPNVLHHPAVIEQFNKRAADTQLRIADKITAFAGSMTELRQKMISLWLLRQRDPDGADTRAAYTEADQSGAAADHARFALRLLTEDPGLLRLADSAFEPISAIRHAAERSELREHEDRLEEILNAFVQAAGRQFR